MDVFVFILLLMTANFAICSTNPTLMCYYEVDVNFAASVFHLSSFHLF